VGLKDRIRNGDYGLGGNQARNQQMILWHYGLSRKVIQQHLRTGKEGRREYSKMPGIGQLANSDRLPPYFLETR